MSYSDQGWEIIQAPSMIACDDLIAVAGAAERLTHPHRTIPLFMHALQSYAGLARRHLGPNISGLGSYYFSQSAGYATHRDNDFVQAEPGAFLTIWLALAGTGNGNGGLVIGGKLLRIPKGSAIIIDGDLPHRSCTGFGPRPVCVLTYIKTGFPFRAGREERIEVPL